MPQKSGGGRGQCEGCESCFVKERVRRKRGRKEIKKNGEKKKLLGQTRKQRLFLGQESLFPTPQKKRAAKTGTACRLNGGEVEKHHEHRLGKKKKKRGNSLKGDEINQDCHFNRRGGGSGGK